MSTKAELLKLLDSNCGSFVSGESLARELGISRAAVNKAATILKKSGYDILSRPSQGYLLREKVDLLTDVSVSSGISRPVKLKVLDSVDSTSTQAKKTELDHLPLVVIANEERKALDRMGNAIPSTGGSALHLSLAIRPGFDLEQASFASMASAMAISKAIEEVCGINPKIKWINDLYHQGKKICGISTEAQTNIETGRIHKLIISCIIYCFPPKDQHQSPEDCGYISLVADSFSRSVLAARIVDNLLENLERPEDQSFFNEYRRRCFILGKYITLSTGGSKPLLARAIDVDDSGGLVVEFMEGPRMREMVTITAGEVNLREEGPEGF